MIACPCESTVNAGLGKSYVSEVGWNGRDMTAGQLVKPNTEWGPRKVKMTRGALLPSKLTQAPRRALRKLLGSPKPRCAIPAARCQRRPVA